MGSPFPHIDIATDTVAGAGAKITSDADTADAAVAGRFDSAAPAAAGNPGFAAAEAAKSYSERMERETHDAVAALREMGQKIISSAKALSNVDDASANSLNRIVDALDGVR